VSARDDYPLPEGPTARSEQRRQMLNEIDRLREFLSGWNDMCEEVGRLRFFRDVVLAIGEKSGTHPAGPADDPDWITYCEAANTGWNTLRQGLHALASDAGHCDDDRATRLPSHRCSICGVEWDSRTAHVCSADAVVVGP
jgi:hypothetical protein